MVVDGDSELSHANNDVVTMDAAGEGFVLHFFLHAGDVHIKDGFCGFNQRAGGKEAGQLVAGEERFGKVCLARDARVSRVAEDGGANLLRPSLVYEKAKGCSSREGWRS